jgi:transcriptional accessory protein Tex/SPT6
VLAVSAHVDHPTARRASIKTFFAGSNTYRQIRAYIKHGKTKGEGRMPTGKESPTHFIGIKLTESQLRDLTEYVERTESTTSQTVRRFIREGLERNAAA